MVYPRIMSTDTTLQKTFLVGVSGQTPPKLF